MWTAPRRTQSNQVPLSDLVLEQGALGAAMLVPKQAEILIHDAHPQLFTTSMHRAIFAAICSLGAQHLDYTLLISEMERSATRVAMDVIVHLDDGVVPEISMVFRIERLKKLYRLRCLARLADDLEAWVYARCASSAEIVGRIQTRLEEIEK